MDKQVARYAARKLFSRNNEQEIYRILIDKSSEADIRNVMWSVSNAKRILDSKFRNWSDSGAFKRKIDLNNGIVRMVVQPCDDWRIFRMTIKESAVQDYLSQLFDFVTGIYSVHAIRLGTLTLPVFELALEMKKLDRTMMSFITSNPNTHELKCMFSQVISMIYCMNDKGVVHNDLKPDNIMCVKEDHLYQDVFGLQQNMISDKFYVIDFGLCNLSGHGDDIFFFCWFLFHKMAKYMRNYGLLDVLSKQLLVEKDSIPSYLHDRIKCHESPGLYDFSKKGSKYLETPWEKQFFIDKDVLYQISQKMKTEMPKDKRESKHYVLLSDIYSILGRI